MVQKNRKLALPAVVNPGFESGTPLDGWETTGIVETGGYESEKRLTHPGGKGPMKSIQTLRGISNGWYTLRVWVSSSGKQKEAHIALQDCGENAQTSVPIVRGKWLQIVVSAKVTKHQCTISLYSMAGVGWIL